MKSTLVTPIGRPRKNKVKMKISFSPTAGKAVRNKAFRLGIDMSEYVERLVRADNPKLFRVGIEGGLV